MSSILSAINVTNYAANCTANEKLREALSTICTAIIDYVFDDLNVTDRLTLLFILAFSTIIVIFVIQEYIVNQLVISAIDSKLTEFTQCHIALIDNQTVMIESKLESMARNPHVDTTVADFKGG